MAEWKNGRPPTQKLKKKKKTQLVNLEPPRSMAARLKNDPRWPMAVRLKKQCVVVGDLKMYICIRHFWHY